MKKRKIFCAMVLAMMLSLIQLVGTVVPVNAATTKKCSHGRILSGDFGIILHECGDGICVMCYHGHSKRVVIPDKFTIYEYTLPVWQIMGDYGFSANGVKEIVLPDTVFGIGDKEFDSYEGITFYVHKGSAAEKAVKEEGYAYKYLKNNNSKPQPVKGTTIKRAVRIEKLAKITWKKVKCDKYEIRYSLKKNMKKSKKVTCNKNKTSLVIKKLKKNKKYYAQIRTKTGKKYSAWSKIKVIPAK